MIQLPNALAETTRVAKFTPRAIEVEKMRNDVGQATVDEIWHYWVLHFLLDRQDT